MISPSAGLPSGTLPGDLLERLRGEMARRSLTEFFQFAWPQAVPRPLRWAWYCDALADHLSAVFEGKITRLLINLPFRTAKSTFVSVLFPAWCWLRDPGLRFFTATHTQPYAERDCWAARKLMRCDWYQRLLVDENTNEPVWRWVGDQNEKGRYYNDHNGFRIATHVGAGTGEGGDINIVDDPTTTDDAKSPVMRDAANEWFFGSFYSRQNDFTSTRIVVMQQRQHPQDLSGEILKRDLPFEHLCLSLEYRPELRKRPTKLGWEDPRTTRDERLDKVRWTDAAVAELKTAMLPEDWEAQANQNPQHSVSVAIRPEWVRRWGSSDHPLPAAFTTLIQSWDCALKGKEKDKPTKQVRRSYVVGTVWGFLGARAYLLDIERGQWDLVETQDALRRLTKRWPAATAKYIEAEANGPAIISSMQTEIGGMIPVEPRGSKYARIVATQPFWRAGNVLIPLDMAAPWVREYFYELTNFPNTDADDQVDSTSQALTSIWQVGTFDYAFGPEANMALNGQPQIAPHVSAETGRALLALFDPLLNLSKELMARPAAARSDIFWRRWGLISSGRPDPDPVRAEAVITTSSSADDLTIAILSLVFNLPPDSVRPIVVSGIAAASTGDRSPVERALDSLRGRR